MHNLQASFWKEKQYLWQILQLVVSAWSLESVVLCSTCTCCMICHQALGYVHLHGQDKPQHSLEEAIDKYQNAVQFLDAIEAAAKEQSGKVAVQGPEGSPASQTVQNARMILTTLRNIKGVLEQTSPDYINRLDLSSLLTLVCERLFSTVRSRYEMPMVLQFAQLFSPVVRESLKQMSS